MHAYFTGTGQHNGRLPRHHLDFRSEGGYILAPPSQVGGRPYRALDADPVADLSPLAAAARQAGLDEPEITRTLDSARNTRQPNHQAEGAN